MVKREVWVQGAWGHDAGRFGPRTGQARAAGRHAERRTRGGSHLGDVRGTSRKIGKKSWSEKYLFFSLLFFSNEERAKSSLYNLYKVHMRSDYDSLR